MPRAGDARGRPISNASPRPGRPAAGFNRFDLSPELLRAVADAGYTAPRPIQEQVLPAALDGIDVLGLAQTGTGKTAAFVLPILQYLLDEPDEEQRARRGPAAPRALVVTPTRELAAQVQGEFAALAKYCKLRSTTLFGGVPVSRQLSALRSRPQIVVACPGRLLDLLDQRALRLDEVETLVLDEADHMFDMGFLPSVRRILKALPRDRQNLLFSATMPKEIRGLADAILDRPEVVELAHSQPARTISHALYPVSEGDKIGALENLLDDEGFRSAIVFARTKRRAKKLAERLNGRGHEAVAMQGNMSQPQRERALKGFRTGQFDILVATDIAARGLDVDGVSHVVNFDVPNTPDAYTHRIGRTGRAEREGSAYTFVTADDAEAIRAIEKRLGKRITRRRLDELGPIDRVTLKGGKAAARKAAASPKAGRRSKSRSRKSSPAGGSRPAAKTKSPPRSASRSSSTGVSLQARPVEKLSGRLTRKR